jgi:hypothetical protein
MVALLFCLAHCSRHGDDEQALKDPATTEQTARILDLSQFPRLESAQNPNVSLAQATYVLQNGNVKSAFEFQRNELVARGWKQSSRDTSVTDQAATTSFRKNGFVVSVSAFPAAPTGVTVSLVNHGNVRYDALPRPPGAKPVYVGDLAAIYVTDTTVPETAAALQKLLISAGWQPYGKAGDTTWFKQNAVRLSATVSSAPAQGGKTMISLSSELMSADLPAPPDADDLRYADTTRELTFESPAAKQELTAFYQKTLAGAQWKSTLEKLVDIDDRPTMIFRNPAKDMLTLAFSAERNGRTPVSLQFQSAAEIADLERRLDAQVAKARVEREQAAREKAAAAANSGP